MTSDSPELRGITYRVIWREFAIRSANMPNALNATPAPFNLVAVSKTFPIAAVREAINAGQLHFGENRVQEGLPKIAALGGVRSTVSHDRAPANQQG